MDTRFLKSKEFVIAAVVAAALLLTTVVASTGFIGDDVFRSEGCSVQEPTGQLLEADHRDTGAIEENDRTRRQVTWAITPPDGSGILRLCTEVGDVEITPTDGEELRVEFTIINKGPGAREAVEDLEVQALFAEDDGQLEVGAWQASQTQTEGFFDHRSTTTDLEILLPADRVYDVEVTTDVGDVTLAGPSLGTTDVTTDVGDVEGRILDLRGDLTLQTDVGDVDLGVSSALSGHWQVTTDVGDVDLTLPSGDSVGYDISAEADVGDVDLHIGPTERSTSESQGASESAQARSEGYDSKTIQIRLTVTTDVGDIDAAI